MRELRKHRWSRLKADVEFINPNICFCFEDPPEPDPAIGQAAMANAEVAKESIQLGKDQLAWNKERAARTDPLIEKVVNQQIASSDTNSQRAEAQWQIYRDLFQPVEQRMVSDANNFDSPERRERMAAEAGADVTRGYQGILDQQQRQIGRLGVNPNSGRFAALNNEMRLNQAKDTAGAMNNARRNTEMQGIALRTGAAQFGRNMPNTGIAADSLALNGGNSAVGNMAAGANMNNAANATAQNWFGGAVGANNSAGGLLNNLYGNQLQAYQTQQDALGGIGSLVGTLGSAAMLAELRKGGMVRNGNAYSISPGGLGMLKRKGYAEGGMIEGPGTGDSDSIPATIEGEQPIRLSNGEAVLNKEAVDLVGEDFVHRINAGGLAMLAK